jgi:hypothetical protein
MRNLSDLRSCGVAGQAVNLRPLGYQDDETGTGETPASSTSIRPWL